MIYFIIILCFLLRALPRLRLKNVFNSDTFFHLYCARVIRENAFSLPEKLPRVILNHAYTYPYLYHFLLSLFPLRWRLWVERLTGAIFDTISLILIYLFSGWSIRNVESGDRLQEIPLLVVTLFAFSPGLLRIGSGPRAYNGSPRVLGQTLYLLHLLAGYYAYATQSATALAVSLLCGAALILAAKFGSQVLIFFGLFFTLWVTYQYLLLLMGCFLLAIVLSKGRAWGIILGHVRHSSFYVKYLQRVFLFPWAKTFWGYCRTLLGKGYRILNGFRVGDAVQWFYSERYFLHILITVYPQFFFIFGYIQQINALRSLDRFLLVWMGAGLICFLVTVCRPFLFLGEGERYLEYALFPSLFLMVQFLPKKLEGFIGVFLIYSIMSALFALWQYQKQNRQQNEDYERNKEIFTHLGQLPEGVIMPIGSFHYQSLYNTRLPVLTHGSNIDEKLLPKDEFMLVYGHYPYPSEYFQEIVDRYRVSYIMSDPETLSYYRNSVMRQPEIFDRSVRILWESRTLMIGKTLR